MTPPPNISWCLILKQIKAKMLKCCQNHEKLILTTFQSVIFTSCRVKHYNIFWEEVLFFFCTDLSTTICLDPQNVEHQRTMPVIKCVSKFIWVFPFLKTEKKNNVILMMSLTKIVTYLKRKLNQTGSRRSRHSKWIFKTSHRVVWCQLT